MLLVVAISYCKILTDPSDESGTSSEPMCCPVTSPVCESISSVNTVPEGVFAYGGIGPVAVKCPCNCTTKASPLLAAVVPEATGAIAPGSATSKARLRGARTTEILVGFSSPLLALQVSA